MPSRSIAVVIPAYKPSPALAALVESLLATADRPIVIVDDGSGPEYRDVFARVEAFSAVRLLRHAVNLGKGAALKTAINHVLCEMPDITGIVTADADGQHDPDDIRRVAEALEASPASLVLGCRAFGKDVPLRSRFGNILTRAIMHALLGRRLTDTQTGLRGIPASFLPHLLRLETTGYEFELQMLIASHELSIPLMEVPIRTIYEAGNRSSHFNPIVDSMKIYFVLLRFGSVSLMTALLDNLVFFLAWRRTGNIIASQVLGRAFAVCFNYWMVRRSVFYSHQRHQSTLPKYLALVFASGTASYAGIRFLHDRLGINTMVAKVSVETLLFFANFAVQRLFIFNRPNNGESARQRATPGLVFSLLVAVIFAALVGVEIHGFWTGHLFSQEIWMPVGLVRFSRYTGVYLALAVPLLMIVPWTFAGVLAVLLVVLSAVSVGTVPLLATAYFFVSACALGSKLLGRGKQESLATQICATLVGTGVYVILMTLLARQPIHYRLVWATLLAIPIALDLRGVVRRLAYWISLLRRAELRPRWERAAFALVAFLVVAHWFVVLEPEKSADGLAMHLAIPMNIAANHAMTFQPSRVVWSVMPMGADWAYSIVYLLGGEYAARLLNFVMLLLVLAMIYLAARRRVSSAAAWLLAASFAATPVVQVVTGSLFVENFLAALVLGLVTATWLFGDTGERRYLFAAMLLGGAAMTTKLGAVAFVAIALPFLGAEVAARWRTLSPKPAVTCALALLLLLATAVPTYAIAYGKTGNPVYPFENRKWHSPLLDPAVDFNDIRYRIPLDWGTLYHLTFRTSDAYEGQNGSFGFQYLVVLPLALAGLLVVARRPTLMAAVVGLGASLLIMRTQPNVRYLYAAMPLVTVGFAGLLGWLRANERWMYRVLIVFLVAATGLNAWFLPSASYYHKDFCLRRPFSREARERYLEEAVPVRKVTEYYNAHHGRAAVLLTDDSAIAGLDGEVYCNNWHQYPVVEQIRRAFNVSGQFQLMRRWKVEYFIGRKPAAGEQAVRPPALKALLSACTVPIYELGDYYLSRLESDCDQRGAAPRPPAQPTIVGRPGFYDDFDPAIVFHGDWDHDATFEAPARHTVSYTDLPGADIVFAFDGKALTYVFTRALNRGIAAVTIDGEDQGTIDLYARSTEWQVSRRFCCFAPGRHTAVIRVTGRSRPEATGRFVDVDALVVE